MFIFGVQKWGGTPALQKCGGNPPLSGDIGNQWFMEAVRRPDFFFDIESEFGDFLNTTRAVYCISGDFGSVFSSKNYDFSVLLAKSFRNLLRMCFQVTKQ